MTYIRRQQTSVVMAVSKKRLVKAGTSVVLVECQKVKVKLKNKGGTPGNFTVSGFRELGAEGKNDNSRSKQAGYISFTL